MDLDKKAIGARLRAMRISIGESQEAFGKRIPEWHKWHQTAMQRLEVGERTLSAAEAIRLADSLGLTLDEFFGRTETDGPSPELALARQSLARIHEITARFAKAVS